MDVSVDPRWTGLIEGVIDDGRYASAEAVVDASLRLLEEHERKLQWLRDTIDASLSEGGSYTDEEVGARLEAALREHRRKKAAA